MSTLSSAAFPTHSLSPAVYLPIADLDNKSPGRKDPCCREKNLQMRKFFSFRSSPAPSIGTNNNSPDPKCEKVHWEKPSEKTSADEDECDLRTPGDSPGSHRRRLSPSSPATTSHLREGFLSPLGNDRTSPCSFSSSSRHHCKLATNTRSSTPTVLQKSGKKNEVHRVRRTSSFQSMDDAGCFVKDFNNTSRNSPCNSPVPLRCRTARVTQISNGNNMLDRFVDGEQHERKSTLSSDFENDDCLAERTLLNAKRPPRSHSTAPSSPTFSKQNMRSYSFGEARDLHPHPSIPDWAVDKLRVASPAKSKKNFDRSSHALPFRSKMTSRDYDSETTFTVEDIYDDRSYSQQDSSVYVASFKGSVSDHPSENGSLSGESLEDYLASQRQKYSLGNISRGKQEFPPSLKKHEDEIDDRLAIKLREAEERFTCQTDFDLELEKLENSNVCIPRLVQLIKDINGDRRNLVLELLTQIQCQISERSSSKEALKQAIIDLDTRTRRLEKEKNELQLNLERELDRRSNDWSVKLEKFQAEEHRLRERVRELAEQNVHLQRELSSLNSREEGSKSLIMNLETQLNELTAMVEEVNLENQNLRQTSSELEARSHSAAVDRDCIKSSYKEKEKENRDFQRAIARFQKMCNDQEKTIAGLRKEYGVVIGKHPSDTDDIVSRLRSEHIRLTGVEQTLRKDLESYSCEVEALRHENICLLDRLQKTKGGCGISVFKLEQELQGQVKEMESIGLSMVNAYRELCSELLEFLKSRHQQKINSESEEYSVFEYKRKLQNLKETTETWRRSFLFLSAVLGEKSRFGDLGHEHAHSSCGSSQELTPSNAENNLELELKAEMLLTKVLREKMCSKELEIERQHEDIASLLRGSEISKNEIQRMKDEICILSYKAKDMDLQMSRKDENFKQLELDLKECKKDFIANRNILSKVSEERDRLWEEVQSLKEENMLLNNESKSLKKKIDALDENLLVKEGQITILRDSIGNTNHFDNLLCSPRH